MEISLHRGSYNYRYCQLLTRGGDTCCRTKIIVTTMYEFRRERFSRTRRVNTETENAVSRNSQNQVIIPSRPRQLCDPNSLGR